MSEARVWAGALLSGPDTIVIAAANHIPASKPDPPAIEPARNVTITVQLPPYLEDVQGFEEHRSLEACQLTASSRAAPGKSS